jgi:hypothetical protein
LADRAKHKVPPLRFASVGMTELFSLRGDGRVFSAPEVALAVSSPTFAQRKDGAPSVGLGGKEPGAEILRWEAPALPETPPPQDDVNFPALLLR